MIQETEYGLGKPMHLPCGSVAEFDHSSGISYRCEMCNAVVGSVGQPRSCKDEIKKYDLLSELGSTVKWDYQKGCEVTS